MSLGLHILDLPVDVLTLILAPLVRSPQRRVPLCVCARGRGLADALPILLAHPALYAVAWPLLYGGANRFVLDLRGEHGGHVRNHLRRRRGREANADESDGETGGSGGDTGDGEKSGGGFLLLQREARRRVRRMEVRMDRLRGWVDEGITPLVEDMLVRGALAELDVTLDLAAARARGRGMMLAAARRGDLRGGGFGSAPGCRMDLDVFARPPVRGLLRLLADPDLRRGRLRISWAHGDAWCAFHGGGCGRTDPDPADGDGDGDGDEGLVEVDWRAIVRELDPEGKGRAVALR